MEILSGLSLEEAKALGWTTENKLLAERIGRIIMTAKGERVNDPGFGTPLETFLFNRGSMLKQHVESTLIKAIETYEQRVSVVDANITVDENKHTATIKIVCQRKDTLELLTFEEYITV